MRRLRAAAASLAPGALAGACFAFGILRLALPAGGGRAGGALLVGALYGAAVAALVRLFPLAPWGYAVAGFVVGPVPAALLVRTGLPAADRGGVWVLTAFLGLLVGLIEAARRRTPRDG